MSESLPAHARKVSSWLLGWLIHALKKLNSPRAAAFARASLYTGSYLRRKGTPSATDCLRATTDAPFVMFDPADDVVLLGSFDEGVMMREQLGGRLRDQNVQTALNRVKCDWEVSAYNRR